MAADPDFGLWLPSGAPKSIELRTIRTDAALLEFILTWNTRPAARIELSARQPHQITRDGLAIALSCAQLSAVCFSHIPDGDFLLNLNVDGLRSLEISNMAVFHSAEQFFAQTTALHHFSAEDCAWVTGDTLTNLRPHLLHLQALQVFGDAMFNPVQLALFVREHTALRRLSASFAAPGLADILRVRPPQLRYIEISDREGKNMYEGVADACVKHLVVNQRDANAPLPDVLLLESSEEIDHEEVRERAALYLAALANFNNAHVPLDIVYRMLFH